MKTFLFLVACLCSPFARADISRLALISGDLADPVSKKSGMLDVETFKRYLLAKKFDQGEILAIKIGKNRIAILVSDELKTFYGRPSEKLLGYLSEYKSAKCQICNIEFTRMNLSDGFKLSKVAERTNKPSD
jgi:hypothetical protein